MPRPYGSLNNPWTEVGGIHDRQVAAASYRSVMTSSFGSPDAEPRDADKTRHLAGVLPRRRW